MMIFNVVTANATSCDCDNWIKVKGSVFKSIVPGHGKTRLLAAVNEEVEVMETTNLVNLVGTWEDDAGVFARSSKRHIVVQDTEVSGVGSEVNVCLFMSLQHLAVASSTIELKANLETI